MVDETPKTDFVPHEEMVIEDLETLKVLADPLRLTILEYLMKPSTVKRIAGKIGKPATKLYYHFNLLEKHNLIQLVDTRIVSGIIEKHYRASARTYRVARGLLAPGQGNPEDSTLGLELTLGSLLTDIKNDITESVRDGVIDLQVMGDMYRGLTFTHRRTKLTEAQSREFQEKFKTLLEEYFGDAVETSNETNPDARVIKFTYVFHPSSRSLDADTNDDE